MYSCVLFTTCEKVYAIFSCYQELIEVTYLHIYSRISTSLPPRGLLCLPSGLVEEAIQEIVDIAVICFTHMSFCHYVSCRMMMHINYRIFKYTLLSYFKDSQILITNRNNT